MQKGKHAKLLTMVCEHLAEYGPEFASLANTHRISSARPGTSDCANKCEFSDGRYIAVVEDPKARNAGIRVNTLAFGYGTQKPWTYARSFSSWDPEDRELKAYARNTAHWVHRCLTNLPPASSG